MTIYLLSKQKSTSAFLVKTPLWLLYALISTLFVFLFAFVASAQEETPLPPEAEPRPQIKRMPLASETEGDCAPVTQTEAINLFTDYIEDERPPKVLYEGGVFGFNLKKKTGYLNFDRQSQQIVLEDKKGRKILSIPFAAVNAVAIETDKRTPGWVGLVSAADQYGVASFLLPMIIKAKDHHLFVQFQLTDTQVYGMASFRFNKPAKARTAAQLLARNSCLIERPPLFVRLRKTGAEK